MTTCADPTHAALIEAAADLDDVIDAMKGDVTERERELLDALRAALRRIDRV